MAKSQDLWLNLLKSLHPFIYKWRRAEDTRHTSIESILVHLVFSFLCISCLLLGRLRISFILHASTLVGLGLSCRLYGRFYRLYGGLVFHAFVSHILFMNKFMMFSVHLMIVFDFIMS